MTMLRSLLLWLWLGLAPVFAQVGQAPSPAQLRPVPSGGSFSLTFGSQAASSSTGTTISYGTVTWGPGCSAVILAVNWYNTNQTDTISSISVGAQSASAIAGATIGAAPVQVSSSLWQLNSPSGASALVSVTYSAATTYNSSVAAYCLVTSNTTVQSSNSAAALTGVNASAAVSVPTGGGAVVTGGSYSGAAITWTNATQDAVVTTGGVYQSAAHTTATGSVTVTNTPAAATANTVSIAAFGP